MAKNQEPPIDIFELSNWITIGIFKGQLSEFDIRVKYTDFYWTKKWRQPKHIHWIVDWMLKREHNLVLIKWLVLYFQEIWDKNTPDICTEKLKLLCSQKTTLKDVFNDVAKDIAQFEPLNKNGYYHVDFLIFSGYLLLLQEKNNNAKAYMFQRMFSALWKDYSDLYKVITDATSNFSKK